VRHKRTTLGTLLALLTVQVHAQPAGKKEYAFRGTVEQVDAAARRITVRNEPIEGGRGVLTMAYAVDNEDVVNRIKAGDQITAKVYAGDFNKLYAVQVAAPAAIRDLRLEDLERMALAHNPTHAQAQANVRVEMGLARHAGLYPNPTVGYYGDEIRGGFTAGGKQGGFISQSIVLGGKLRAARTVAEAGVREAETSAQIQRLRILGNVRVSFYRVLAAQKLEEVRQNLAKMAGDAAETSHQLGNVGQADRPDVLRAEVEQQRANVSLGLAQQDVQASWRMLAAVAGQPDLPVARLEGDLEAIPDLNYEEWSPRHWATVPK